MKNMKGFRYFINELCNPYWCGISLTGNHNCLYEKLQVHFRVLFVRTKVANHQKTCKHRFILRFIMECLWVGGEVLYCRCIWM